ncbi:MAG: flagellar hook-length control protein FliK [Deltaproteobacteria bacterium]|nr:flagellar hook-length control protein FliK [Deltaproteobacteria bacterium]
MPAYLIDQVSRQISRSMLAGERAIRFRLTPPELGTLKLVLKVNKNSVKVEMMTESSAAKEIILSNIGDLKAALLDQGVRLEKIDIQNSGGMFGQSFADWREGPGGRENRGGQEMQGMAAAPSSNDEAVERSRPAKKITAGIWLIFRGLFFEQNAEIGQKGHLWTDTN